MKHIHIVVEDSEESELLKVKGSLSWHDLLMSITKVPAEGKR
jgi:hypothetical protein